MEQTLCFRAVSSSLPTHCRKEYSSVIVSEPCVRDWKMRMFVTKWRWKSLKIGYMWNLLTCTIHNLIFFSLCQVVMDQLNPGLKNLVNLGKSYEKSVTGKRRYHLHAGFRRSVRPEPETWPCAIKSSTRSDATMCFVSPRSHDPRWKGLLWRRLKGGRERHGLAGLQRARWVTTATRLICSERGILGNHSRC